MSPWANTDTDPLTFPPGAGSGQQVLAIGSRVPTGLAVISITAAIVFYAADGSYTAIVGDSSAAVAVYTGTSYGDLSPVKSLGIPHNSATPITIFRDIQLGGLTDNFLLPRHDVYANPLTYQANWSDYGAGFAAGSYMIDGTGWVKLQGLVLRSTSASAPPQIIATGLPHPKDGLGHFLGQRGANGGAGATIDLLIDGGGNLTDNSGSVLAGQNITLDGLGYQS